MIWVALLIGATVLFSAWLSRSPSDEAAFSHPRNWLVLPDEPSPAPPTALLAPAARPALPVVAVAYASWSGSDEGWRAEKPFRPWYRSPAPYAAAVAFGAMSLDLTALGMGVPEIFPTHLPIHHDDRSHDRHEQDHAAGLGRESFAAWTPEHPDPLAGLFDTHHAADAGFPHPPAWDQADFIAPSWDRPHEAGHDWWA